MKWSKAISIGKSKKQQGQNRDALRYFKKALEIAQKNKSKKEEAGTFLELGELCFHSLENYNQAVKYYEQGLVIAQEIGDRDLELECRMCCAHAYHRLGQYDHSAKFAKQALDIAIRLENSMLIAKAYSTLGNSYESLYEYQNSIKCHKKAMDIFKQLGDEDGLGVCYSNLSIVYQKQGKFHDAIFCQEESFQIAVNMSDKKMQASSLFNLGNIYLQLNNHVKAADCYQQSLVIAEEIGNKGLQGKCYRNLGIISRILKKYEDAIFMYLNQLKIAEELDEKESQASTHLNIGNCLMNMNQYQDAMVHLNNSLDIAKEINAKHTEASVYYNIADINVDIGEFQEAINMLEKSLDILSSIGDKQKEMGVYNQLGCLYHLLSKSYQDQETHANYLSKSEEYLQNALDCHDYLFTHLRHHDHFKISKFDEFIKTYKRLTSVLIEKQQLQEALLVSDRGRARALGDRLTSTYGISQEEYLTSKSLTYSDVEKVLSNNSFTLVHYSLLDECLAVWVLTKDSTLTFKKVDKEQFTSAIESLFGEDEKEQEDTVSRFFVDIVARAYEELKIKEEVTCENRSLDDYMTPTDQKCDGVTDSVSRDDTGEEKADPDVDPFDVLYNTLIAPVMPHVQHDEIVIVPDGKMYKIPFAVLEDPNTGKYLSESKRIHLVPSIAVLKLLQECSVDQHSQQGALIVGNPSVGKVKLRGKERTFKPLNDAQKEARAIDDVLKEAAKIRKLQPNITLLAEQKATKGAVLAKMKEGTGIIHIAAHGSVNYGEILLAPAITSQDRQGLPEEEDYLLTMKEVQEVGVKAQLVVLSCCHSGRGEVRAEGMIGMSRAFLAAGAQAVVASLWAISDTATYYFMVTFYESLCRGNSASVSLKKAVDFLRTHHYYNDPKHWAPFFLIGDDVTINFGQ